MKVIEIIISAALIIFYITGIPKVIVLFKAEQYMSNFDIMICAVWLMITAVLCGLMGVFVYLYIVETKAYKLISRILNTEVKWKRD